MIKYFVNNVSDIILICYVLLLGRLIQLCYGTADVNYLLLIIITLGTLFIYYSYRVVLKKTIYKLLFTVLLAILVLSLQYFSIININLIFNGEVIKKINYISKSFDNSVSVSFSNFKLILIIMLPTFLIGTLLLRDKIAFAVLFFTIPVMILFWNNGIDIKKYIAIYIILSFMDISTNIYKTNIQIAFKRKYKYNISKHNILLYSCLMVIATIIFTAAAAETFGTLSLSQANSLIQERLTAQVDSSKNRYNIANSGYGNNSEILGGPIKLNYDLAFKVKSDKILYLRGNVLDYYNGYGWISSQYTFINNVNSKEFSKNVKSIEIYQGSLKTSSFFTPLNTLSIHSEANSIQRSEDDIFYEEGKNTVQGSYAVDYDGTSDSIFDNSSISYSTDYQKDYGKYLQVPVNITEDTKNLVKNITKSSNTNFDKLKSIEEYLKTNYKYTLNVKEVPKDREFIDNFLFSEKKGYCTYFASAATIMARLAGIPARYVEGFSMDNVQDKDGLYLVGNNRAHAWTEVLVSSEKNTWAILDCVPNSTDTSENQHAINISSNYNKPTEVKDITVVDTKTKHINKLNVGNLLKIIIKLAISIIFILGVFYGVRKAYKKHIYEQSMLKDKSIIPLYYYSRKRVSKISIQWDNCKSDMEAAEAINDNKLREMFIDIVKVFYEEYYGGIMDTSLDKRKFYNDLEVYIRKHTNIIKYYFYRLFG